MRAFTLIELIIVMTIIAILAISSYAPYDYYGRVSRVRVSRDIISQAVADAKNLASNGYIFPGTDQNANIGLKIEKDATSIDMIAFQSGSTSFVSDTTMKLIKTVRLEDGVQINTVFPEHALIYFTAPNGDTRFYGDTNNELTATGIDIGIGWKIATTGPLSRNVHIRK
ncbi:MAG: prepilin-type N-terminal cleavage/methylation domain-containing protein [Candidatus Gracilibacteria bacterium]|nr:prepilin-type N-terminal cleavage/methylation domain-containing protein [Candidatus Gracilibacteria bacterium]